MKSKFKTIVMIGVMVSACVILFPITLMAQWELIDSADFQVRLTAETDCFIAFTPYADSLEITLPERGLTETALLALERSPDWLKPALEDNLARIDSWWQETFAGMILNSDDPYVDELCFEIAHISPQNLMYMESLEALDVLTENITFLYSIDSSLSYADIIDYGNSSQGGDYYSTINYRVEENGDTLEFELPRDIYYWYVVHPKLHKEVPSYIYPNSGGPAPPPYGFFWRDFLMNHADEGYPVLADMLTGVETLWNNIPDTTENGAIGVLTEWVNTVMDFQSSEHHDQPVRIYHLHIGTCSVHAYLTSAAARAALIPAVVNVMYRDNHKINEFWDRRWISWEPEGNHIDNPHTYDPGWDWNIAAVFNWKGNSFIWDVTERYTEVCTLNVSVADSSGNPIDGARIMLASEGFVGWGATCGWTTEAGQKQFLLGDSRNFTGRIDSEVGSYPSSGTENIITGSYPESTYTWNVIIPGAMPRLEIHTDTFPDNPMEEYKIELEFNLPSEILYGDNFDDNDRFSEFVAPGQIDFFICNQANFNDYIDGNEFDAFEIQHGVSDGDIEFTFPTNDTWYLVFSNEKSIVLSQELEATAHLYRESTGISEGDNKSKPRSFGLLGNYPNPFNAQTTIRYTLPNSSDVVIDIYDLLGCSVKTMYYKEQPAGYYQVVWDAAGISSGVYFYRIKACNSQKIRKMVLLK
ncbi:MAG: T9SS type A sorting domain-containing protein [candidate division Zixibacteria bacterium]|nr:T9SS type A sorting domain-containing protein [candidate division Zixibacteria bacterium]